MDGFTPGLRETVVALTINLRSIVFFVCVSGFMIQVQRARNEIEGLVGPIVRGTVVVALIAALPQWFGFTEKLFLGIADVVREGYTEHPMEAATQLRGTIADNTDFSLRRVGESIYQAMLWAGAKLLVLVASLIQLPFLLLQHVLKLLCYLFLPIALATFMVPSLTSLGVRYLQQTLAVLAWPVGFAVTELVAFYLLSAYKNNLAIAYGLTPGQIDASSFASLLGGLLGALWLLIGTLGTPFVMQMLFCSGAPISGGGQSALQQLQTIARLVSAVKTGGATAIGITAKTSSSIASNSVPPPTPPSAPPPATPAAPPPTPPKSDPGGDRRASAALALAQLPKPLTTI